MSVSRALPGRGSRRLSRASRSRCTASSRNCPAHGGAHSRAFVRDSASEHPAGRAHALASSRLSVPPPLGPLRRPLIAARKFSRATADSPMWSPDQWPTLRDGSSRKGVAARLVEACQYDALDYTGIPSRDSNIDASEESSKEKDRGQTASL